MAAAEGTTTTTAVTATAASEMETCFSSAPTREPSARALSRLPPSTSRWGGGSGKPRMPVSATSVCKSSALLVGDVDNTRKTGKQEGWISSNKRMVEGGKQGVRAGAGGSGGDFSGARGISIGTKK